MATKYILLSKQTNKPIDKRPYTLDQLKEKVYTIKQEQNLNDEQMNEAYGYLEIDDGVPAEQNTSAQTQSGDDEFKSTENNDSKYAFAQNNDISSAKLSDDAAGWNRIVDDVKVPSSISLDDYKEYLTLKEDEKGNWPIQKNAIRVLYLYNEFLKFYAECTSKNVPAGLRGWLRTKNKWFPGARAINTLFDIKTEYSLDIIKVDMEDSLKDMLDHLKAFSEGDDPVNERQEVYDEIQNFDEEIQNLHMLFYDLSDLKLFDNDAIAMAKNNEGFKKFCGDTRPTTKLLAKFLLEKATKQYHLNRIKMDFTKEDSTPEWMSPEDQESENVRLSDDVNDYLETKDANVLNFKQTKILDEKNAQELDKIKKDFQSGNMTQQQAQSEINKLVSLSRTKLRTALKLFFEFMGIKDTNIMNKFASGLGRLDEDEYNEKWRSLVEHYKEAMKNKIQMYTKAHSSDMSDENLDLCVQELNGLLNVAAAMEKDIKAKNGEQLLRDVQQICDCIAKVNKMTADAKKSFAKQ